MEGLVLKSTGKWLVIKSEDGEIYQARIRGKLKLLDLKHTNPVAVGDRVLYSFSKSDEVVVEAVLERRNYVIRKATKASKQTHIIAANIDYACLVISLKSPETPLGFIDRFLVSTASFGIPTVLIINKKDLYENDENLKEKAQQIEQVYKLAGYSSFFVSTKTGEGFGAIESLLKQKTFLFSGQSGVGKSSLANTLNSELTIKTSDVSGSNEKGQHTTTFAQMYEFPFGGYLIDTPGIKEFGLVDIDKDELQDYFPEIFSFRSECRFNNCLHIEEPGCIVKEAVERGEIAESRYESYKNLLAECAQ